MGQAKIKAKLNAAIEAKLQNFDLSGLAQALRKLAGAASERFGSDCYLHARLAQTLLAEADIPCEVAVGFAAWRVGPGDADMILHAPIRNMPVQDRALPYHAWLEAGEWLLDFTTYQLRQKAEELDRLDGGSTCVDWCPEYLFVSKKDISPLARVTQEHTGLFYYERRRDLEQWLKSQENPLDDEDFHALRLIFRNPEMQVLGPNSMR